jgi:hypothetical protein
VVVVAGRWTSVPQQTTLAAPPGPHVR